MEPTEHEDIFFEPNEAQERTKASFWVRFRELPGSKTGESINLAMALQLTRDNRLNTWWTQAGFAEWFQDDLQWKVDLELLCYKIPGILTSILAHDNPKALAAQVNAIKLIIESAGKAQPKIKDVKLLDKDVAKMDMEQLKAFIKEGTKFLDKSKD